MKSNIQNMDSLSFILDNMSQSLVVVADTFMQQP